MMAATRGRERDRGGLGREYHRTIMSPSGEPAGLATVGRHPRAGWTGLIEQDPGIADDPARVAVDVGAGGVADAFEPAQAAEEAEGFHRDDGRQDAAHAD